MSKKYTRSIRVPVYIDRALYRRMLKIRDRWPPYTLSTQFQIAATIRTKILEDRFLNKVEDDEAIVP